MKVFLSYIYINIKYLKHFIQLSIFFYRDDRLNMNERAMWGLTPVTHVTAIKKNIRMVNKELPSEHTSINTGSTYGWIQFVNVGFLCVTMTLMCKGSIQIWISNIYVSRKTNHPYSLKQLLQFHVANAFLIYVYFQHINKLHIS